MATPDVEYVVYAVAIPILAYLALPGAAWVATLYKAAVTRKPRGQGNSRAGADVTPVPLLFLVPAYNEAMVIERCVRSLLGQEYPPELLSVVVVADNCTDETEATASRLGARCLARTDPDHPGKPQAIAWALQRLGNLRQWDACVIIDADSEVAPEFAKCLVGCAPLRNEVFQAYYGISNPGGSWLTRLASVLSRARYEVEYPLKSRAGLNCPLTGNGMCIGTEILAEHGWTAFSLTENWELYADYTARGIRIGVANRARLFALETEGLSASRTRRSRWSRGRAQVLRSYWRPIARSRAIGWHQKLDTLAELANLPPTVHASVALMLAIVLYVVFHDAPSRWLASIALLTLLPLASINAISLAKDPQPLRTGAALLMLPFYAFWRACFFLETLLLHRGSVWRKTERS